MHIRPATTADLPAILAIYRAARAFMAETGNPTQWGPKSWPPEALIRQDIEAGKSYVCQEAGKILAVFYFDIGCRIEPTYASIEGDWKGDDTYGVVHRIAVSAPGRGVGRVCLDWAYQKCRHLRIDTHRDNRPMQALLEKTGFGYCGVITLSDGSPRLAYEKL